MITEPISKPTIDLADAFPTFPSKEIKITVEKQTVIKINGVDKELVSKIDADIKNLKQKIVFL